MVVKVTLTKEVRNHGDQETAINQEEVGYPEGSSKARPQEDPAEGEEVRSPNMAKKKTKKKAAKKRTAKKTTKKKKKGKKTAAKKKPAKRKRPAKKAPAPKAPPPMPTPTATFTF